MANEIDLTTAELEFRIIEAGYIIETTIDKPSEWCFWSIIIRTEDHVILINRMISFKGALNLDFHKEFKLEILRNFYIKNVNNNRDK